MGKKQVEIVRYNDSYQEQYIEFIRKVWVKDMTKEVLIQKAEDDLKNNPYGKESGFPVVIALQENKVVGHIALKPCGFLLNGKEVPGYWQAGIHVFPEARSQGIATRMSKLLTEDIQVATGFFVVEQTMKLKKRLGWDLPGKLPEYIKFIRPKEFIEKINFAEIKMVPDNLKKVFKIIHKFWRNPTVFMFTKIANTNNRLKNYLNPVAGISNIKVIEKFDKRVDDLWEHNKQYLSNAQVRKSDYLNWAFDDKKGWVKAIYELDGKVLGYVVLAIKHFKSGARLSNITAASIIDIFWDLTKIDIFRELITFSEDYASKNNAEVLFCTINHKNIKKYLKKSAFFEIPKSVNFSIITPREDIKYSKNMSDWFITRGDADAAGTLGMEIRE